MNENLVVECANHLDTSEYEVFRRAHLWWFGTEPSEKLLDKLFKEYLLENRVPPYVAQFARVELLYLKEKKHA